MKLLPLLLLTCLGCDRVTHTAYPSGWASIAAIVPSGIDDSLFIQSRWTQESVIAYPGDSVCLRFWSDGTSTQFFDAWRKAEHTLIPWLPARGAMHLTVITFGVAQAALALDYGPSAC